MTTQHPPRNDRSRTHKIAGTLGIAALITLSVCAVTWAVDDGDKFRNYPRGGGGPMAMMDGGRMGRFMIHALDRHVDLTDEQYAAIESILESSRTEGEALRTRMEPLHEQIRAQIHQDGFDEGQVRILLENQSPLMIDAMLLRIRTLAEIRDQLTPEQQQLAEEMFEHRRGRFRH